MATSDPHYYPRLHEYKSNPPKLVQHRPIPSEHFTVKLTGNENQKIEFLPRVSASFDVKKVEVEQIHLQNTLPEFPVDFKNDLEQITQCFDISSKPVWQALKSPIKLRLKFDENWDENCKTVVLMTFDNNNRCWQEIEPKKDEKQAGYFEASVQFFGKFCFFAKPVVKQFMLTEVATSHAISSCEKSGITGIHIKDDMFDQFGAVLSVKSHKISDSHLSRVQESIGIRNVKVDNLFELEISGNKKAKITENLLQVKFESCREVSNAHDKQVIVGLLKTKSGIWKCVDGEIVNLAMGKSNVMFIETDAGNAQDSQKLEFFAGELDFILNSSETTIFVYQHKIQKNRVHIGFTEKDEDESNWTLLGKNEGIVLKENSEILYSIENGEVLKEDFSPKTLKFFKYNMTGLDLYLVRSGDDDVSVKVGMEDLVTKEIGTVLDCKLECQNEEEADYFKPYIQEKVYEHVELPEIYREYKLEYLKYLGPKEREKYKDINGM